MGERVTAAESTPIGTLVGGRFRLDSELGRGGMATVYEATDEALGRTVAIKLFRRGLADGDDLRRQRDEVMLLASLNHPSLVTLYDAAADADGEDAYLVMELVTGQDLRTRLDRGPLTPAEAALIGRHLADALAYTHSRGVIHRDVKPGNILLPERDADHTGPLAKLADFGIARIVDGARLTATGTIVGTAGYFSPEQALGEALTPASDIYSLGLVLLEAITGVRAFPGSAAESMVARLSRDPGVPDDVDEAWGLLIRRMTSRVADARPSAGEVSASLGAIAAGISRDHGVDTVAMPVVAVTRAEDEAATLRYGVTQARQARSADATAATEAFAAVSPPPDAAAPAAREPAASPATADAGVLADPAATPTPVIPGTGGTAPGASRRRILVAGAVTLVVAAAIAVAAMTQGSRPVGPAAPSYPAVDGDLGVHLEQLQRTVLQ